MVEPSRAKLRSESAEPSCMKTRIETDAAQRPSPKTDIDDPSCKPAPYTASVEPRRTRDRTEMELPIVMNSSSETVEPKRPRPNTAMAEPRRLHDRRARVEPTDVKCKVDTVDPSRDMPYMLHDEPRRAKLRSASELPKCTKSRTLMLDPNLAIP